MHNSSYLENIQRGTPDFPAELHLVSSNHPKYFMQMHWQKDFEIIHIIEGTFELTLNENRTILSSGQSAFIPGGIIHGGIPDNCIYECLVFSAGILYTTQRCRNLIKSFAQSAIIFTDNSEITDIFNSFKNKKQGYELSVIGSLYKLLGDIVYNREKAFIISNDRIQKIKLAFSFIEENYNKKITLAELARVCQMSPTYFSRYFKEITGQTPFEYIVTYRINTACEMLLDDSMTVTDVCYNCGFNDLSYFINIFKKHMGISPKVYSHSK